MPVLISPDGDVVPVPDDQVRRHLDIGYRPATDQQAGAALTQVAAPTDAASTAAGLISAGLSGATLGGSDALLAGIGTKGSTNAIRQVREAHPVASGIAEAAGAIAPAFLSGGASLPAGAVGTAGREIGALAGGGLRGAIAGGAAEGALYGAGSGVSQLALSQDPLTWERAAATLSSNALYGAATGGVVGAGANLVERGLTRAGKYLEDGLAARAAREADEAQAANVAPDLVGLDAKGLRAAREAELANVEAARVPQRQQLVDDLGAFRAETRDQKLYLATKDADVKGIGDIKQMAKVSLDADRKIDRLLNNPIQLAENPKYALGALQQQENALGKIVKNEAALRAVFAADETGTRAAALDAIGPALDRNRALQGRIRELAAEPASARLTAIDAAKEALSLPKPKAPEPSLLEKAASGGLFGAITGAAAHIPVLGQIPGVAHLIGAKGAEAITGLVFGRLGKATGAIAERTAKAVDAMAGAAKAARPIAVPLATQTLAAVRYAPSQDKVAQEHKTLPALFKARTDEIKSQTAYDASGIPRMRPEARRAMAETLKPIRSVDPIMADRIETIAARRIEYLSSLIPRQPEFGTPQVGGRPWQPSDMVMRGWARSAAAVEDPHGVEERAINGSLTHEDAAAYWAVYPENAMHFQRSVLERLTDLQKTLPYARRLSLGIFAGVPVDPSMNPRVMAQLQSQFPDEPGSQGGTQAPKPAPQMGSIKKSADAPTPAQNRAQGAHA